MVMVVVEKKKNVFKNYAQTTKQTYIHHSPKKTPTINSLLAFSSLSIELITLGKVPLRHGGAFGARRLCKFHETLDGDGDALKHIVAKVVVQVLAAQELVDINDTD